MPDLIEPKPSEDSDPGSGVQRRYVPLAAGAELRADAMDDADDRLPKIRGVACPWDSLSVELWRDWATNKPVFEKFSRGAFAGVLAENPDVVVLRDHDRLHLLGRTASGTAKVFESERGLEYEVDPPRNEDGRSLVELVRRGDLFGSSFAFMANKVEWEETDRSVIRTIRSVSLLEDVSPVTRAAYPESVVSARSLDSMKQELDAWRSVKELEALRSVVGATDETPETEVLSDLEHQARRTRARLLGVKV